MPKLRRLNSFTLPALLVGAAALGLAAFNSVQDPGKRPPPEHRGEHREHGEEGPLHDAMEQMNGSLRFLMKGVDASTKDKALEAVAKMQSGILAAKVLVPKDVPANEVPGFRKKMVELLAATCKVETALLDDKFDDVAKLCKEELGRLKKEGHDKYQKEDEH